MNTTRRINTHFNSKSANLALAKKHYQVLPCNCCGRDTIVAEKLRNDGECDKCAHALTEKL
jgi:hypothetical protein